MENTMICYRDSNGVEQVSVACVRHLPNTLQNIGKTESAKETPFGCDVCEHDAAITWMENHQPTGAVR